MLISELFTILPKSKRSASYGKSAGKYPFFTSSNSVDLFVDEPDFDGEYLIIGDGGTGNSKYINGKFSASDHNYVLRPRNNTNSRAVNYFLKKDGYQILNEGFKGIGIKNVSKSYIESINYRFNSKFSESQIVADLDKINTSIDLEKRVLFELNNLIKSRFNEIVSSIKSRVSLNDVCVGKPEYGAQSAAAPFEPSRPRYIRITDINDDGTLNDDVMCSSNISDDLKYKLSTGDILFARTGATVGKTYLGSEKNEIFAGYLIRFKLNAQKILPEFLFSYTKTDEYWNWVKLKQSGSGQPGINAQKYSSLAIPFPSIEVQKEFKSFANLIDKLKFNLLLSNQF